MAGGRLIMKLGVRFHYNIVHHHSTQQNQGSASHFAWKIPRNTFSIRIKPRPPNYQSLAPKPLGKPQGHV